MPVRARSHVFESSEGRGDLAVNVAAAAVEKKSTAADEASGLALCGDA
jgi:hypothetical protein